MRLARGDAAVLDDQPGTQTRWAIPGIAAGSKRNRSGTFTTLVASGVVQRGGARIAVRHAFSRDAIATTYRLSRGAATNVTLRMPVWGQTSTIEPLRGAVISRRRIVRRGSGAILMRMRTAEGGLMLVAFRRRAVARGDLDRPIREGRPDTGGRPANCGSASKPTAV